jgi:hypothetical protein
VNIRSIDADDEGALTHVVVRMTAQEAAYLARVIGARNGIVSNETMPGGDSINSEIYLALTGELFNRFYDDGLDGAMRHLGPDGTLTVDTEGL